MQISNPGFDYDRGGHAYSGVRRPDPRIATRIHSALGDSRSVINVGAGTGSYEPTDRCVIALEPSAVMRAQRPRHLPPALIGTADSIPFDDGAFDAAMAILTVHHWPDRVRGLRELRRVTRGPIVIMTFDPDAPTEFWMGEYGPELMEVERIRYGSIESITQVLGGRIEVHSIPVPRDCTDGFQSAFYARPEAFLREEVRKSQSAWGFLPAETHSRIVTSLESDLASGAWDRRYGHLREKPEITCQLRLILASPV